MATRKRKVKHPEFDLTIDFASLTHIKKPEDKLQACGVIWKIESPNYYWTACVDGVVLHIERVMPTASDRGDWKVLAESLTWKHTVDASDFFPRHYFDWDRMILELTEWLRRRALKQRPREAGIEPKIRAETKPLSL